MNKQSSWTNKEYLFYFLSLVKSSKDLKCYHHLQASSTNSPLIGVFSTSVPSHWCAIRWQNSISRSHLTYFSWQGWSQRNHEKKIFFAKSFIV
jgi:hypothetical protein